MNYFKIMLKDKSFLKKTMAITIPIVLQNLLNNVLNLVDTLMIGRLGETDIAAVGLANKVFFVFSLLMFGVCSGSGVLASQYWGKRELLNIRRVLRMSLLIGVGCSFFFVIPGIFSPGLVMRIFTPEAETISEGAKYLAIIAFSYPLTAVSNAYVAILRSMNYVKLPVIITSVSIGVNILFNYAMIFGNFGFPAMGVAGAAIATVIARIVECVSLLTIIHLHKAGDGGVGDFIHLNKEHGSAADPVGSDRTGLKQFFPRAFVEKYLYTAAPVIANEFMWGLGVTMYSLVYGRMGVQATSAITISNTVEQVALVFFFGICAASAVILGNELGADQLEQAEEHAKVYILLQLCLTVLGAVLLLLSRDLIISLFSAVTDTVADYVRLCLTVFAFYMPARMLNALFIVAIFRSGGDTKYALFLDVTGVWLIGIPMAVLGGLILHLPIYVVYGMILLEEFYKLVLGIRRYRKKKWLKNIVAS
jgi:putative MATE family efflux protein